MNLQSCPNKFAAREHKKRAREQYESNNECNRNSMITLKTLNSISATVCIILSIVVMFFPELIFMLFQIDGNEAAYFVGRRASILFLGLAILLWLVRNSNHSSSIQAICAGMSILWGGLAILGSIEFLRGYAGIGIVPPIIIELLLGISYFRLWNSNRNV